MQLQTSQFFSQPVNTADFIEVLTSEINGQPFGYRVVGHDAGPQIVVAGICASAASVFDRLLSIPSLGWIRGSLANWACCRPSDRSTSPWFCRGPGHLSPSHATFASPTTEFCARAPDWA